MMSWHELFSLEKLILKLRYTQIFYDTVSHQTIEVVALETGDNSRRYYWFPREMTRETSAQISYWWRVTTQIRIVLLIGSSKISANQKHYPDPGSVASFIKFLRSLFRRHFVGKSPWWRRKCKLFSQTIAISICLTNWIRFKRIGALV